MALSKKHYEQFAYRFRNTLENIDIALDKASDTNRAAKAVLRGMAVSLSVDFAIDNPRFDRERFLKACGF